MKISNIQISSDIKFHLKLSVVGSEKCVERSVLHELGDDHDWVGLCNNALKKNDVRMLELTHD